MKKLIPLILIVFSGCVYRTGLLPYKHLYTSTDSAYSFKDYNVYFQTKDDLYRLNNISIKENKIRAEITPTVSFGRIGEKKDLIFFTKEKTKKIIKPLLDSAGNKTNAIEVHKGFISKIENSEENSVRRHLAYKDYGANAKRVLLMVIIIGLGAVLAVVLVMLAMVAIFNNSEGCYIASMVYGSYDAPEVLVLRKFRDEQLRPYFMGRVFIRVYYAFSPSFVILFKNSKPVNAYIKYILDKWVERLKQSDLQIHSLE